MNIRTEIRYAVHCVSCRKCAPRLHSAATYVASFIVLFGVLFMLGHA